MRIPRGFFPSRAAAKGKEAELRQNLADCNLVVRDGKAFLCATNGAIGIVLAVEEFDPATDIAGHVPIEAVEAAEVNRTDDWNPLVTAGPDTVIVDLAEQPQKILSASRSNEALYPDLLTGALKAFRLTPTASVCVSVKLLSRLARAMGSEYVELGLHGTDGRGIVTVRRSYKDDRVMAVLAPCEPPAPPKAQPQHDEAPADTETKSLLDEILERYEEERDAARSDAPPASGPACARCGAAVETTISISAGADVTTPPLCPACFEAATAAVAAAFTGADPADTYDEEEDVDA